MISLPLTKIAAPTAAQVTKGFTPSPQAAALLKPEMTPTQYVSALEQNKLSGDAIQTMAHGMPERESVWYACKSSDRVAGQMTPADQAAQKAAETWVKNPTPATQAQAAKAASAANYNGPGAWAAQAAAWSKTTPAAPGLAAAPPAIAGGGAAGAAGAMAIPALAAAGGPAAAGAAVPSLAAAGVPALTPHAASGSVMLAAAMEAKAPIPKLEPPNFQAPPPPAMENPAFTVPEIPAAPELSAPQLAEVAKIQQPYLDLGKEIASGQNTWA